jgi:hypothetical protein
MIDTIANCHNITVSELIKILYTINPSTTIFIKDSTSDVDIAKFKISYDNNLKVATIELQS